jgi:hypothetical protein
MDGAFSRWRRMRPGNLSEGKMTDGWSLSQALDGWSLQSLEEDETGKND